MHRKFIFIAKLVALNAALALLVSCGGGGGGGGGGGTNGPTLESISITPHNPTIAKGGTLQLTATGTYSDSSTKDLTHTGVSWTSLNTGVATVTMTQTSQGLASGVNAGTASILASAGTVSAATTITVVNPTLVSIAVTPANAVVPTGLPRQFAAVGTYNPPLTRDITSQVTWTTSDSNIATMSTTTAGLASGVADGTASVIAIDPTTSVSGSTALSVLPLIGGAIQGTALTLTDVVSTLAGTSIAYGSTDGTGSAARFFEPEGITTDGTNLYVADTDNCTIRKVVIATGQVTTLAGTAFSCGYADGTGSAAKFYSPRGITTDGANLYVTDTLNNVIRKVVIATGQVTTFAGWPYNPAGNTDGTGAAASFYNPYGITTDGTNLYVADTFDFTIRQIVISTRAVTTLAGTAGTSGTFDGTGTAAQFYDPAGITTDGTNLYIADMGNNSIRQLALATKAVTTLAGLTGASYGFQDGTGWHAQFYYPYGITTDGTNLYVADTYNSAIRQVVIATGAVTTPAGSGTCGHADGTGTSATFCRPIGVVTDGKSLYVGDTDSFEIRKVQ